MTKPGPLKSLPGVGSSQISRTLEEVILPGLGIVAGHAKDVTRSLRIALTRVTSSASADPRDLQVVKGIISRRRDDLLRIVMGIHCIRNGRHARDKAVEVINEVQEKIA